MRVTMQSHISSTKCSYRKWIKYPIWRQTMNFFFQTLWWCWDQDYPALCIEDTSKLHNAGLCCPAGLCLSDSVLLHMLERDGGMGYKKNPKQIPKNPPQTILYLCTDCRGLELEFTIVSMFFKLFTTTVTGRMCWSF